jgi:glycosyltransferase involved in cell wall biosynthesis
VNPEPVSLPIVHVLLATYNGERFLTHQWNSIAAQQHVRVVLHVSDDGSTDRTLEMLKALAATPTGAIAEVHWLQAPPRRSAARSFLVLLADAVQRWPDARWFAFCDQDDIWLPGKLQAALAVLAAYEDDERPALYGGRTIAVDEQDREGGLSPLFVRPPAFRNAVAQSIMGGNTMLLNRATARLLTTGPLPEVVSHDWWSYQLVSGAGGFVHYDAQPFVRYRQHGGNAVGSNLGWRARLLRFRRLLRGDFRGWNDLHMRALEDRSADLTADSRAVLQAFVRARRAMLPWQRAAWLRRSGVFRQTPAEQLMLWLACLLRRM